MKKGVVFTLGLSLLALTVLSLSITLSSSRDGMESLVYDLVAMERVYNNYQSAASDLRDLVLELSGIEVTVNNNNVLFTEQLPNPQGAIFTNAVNKYYTFSLNNTVDTQLSLNELKTILPLVIESQNVTYKHNSFGGNQIQVRQNSGGVQNYTIIIEADENITNCTYDFPAGNNTLGVTLQLTGNPGNCNDVNYADLAIENNIFINEGAIEITVLAGGDLTIENNFADSIEVTTRIYLIEDYDTVNGVYLPYGLVESSLESYGMVKGGEVQVA